MKRIIASVLFALGLIFSAVQPAGAAASNNFNWPSGHPMIGSNGNYGYWCSMGAFVRIPAAVGNIPAGYYMVTAKHCVDGIAAQPQHRHAAAGAFWTDYGEEVYYTTGGYNQDLALMKILPWGTTSITRALYAGIAQSRFVSVMNWCTGGYGWGNCSPVSSGVSTTHTRMGYSAPGTNLTGSYLCSVGASSGVSCGTASWHSNSHWPGQPAASHRWRMTNMTGCGIIGGDSGGVVIQVDSNGQPYIIGILTARDGWYVYNTPTNSGCNYTIDPQYGTSGIFYHLSDAVAMFGLTWGVNVHGM